MEMLNDGNSSYFQKMGVYGSIPAKLPSFRYCAYILKLGKFKILNQKFKTRTSHLGWNTS